MERANDHGFDHRNRAFFPDPLAKRGRREMIAAVQQAGMQGVVLGPEENP